MAKNSKIFREEILGIQLCFSSFWMMLVGYDLCLSTIFTSDGFFTHLLVYFLPEYHCQFVYGPHYH